YSPMSRLYLRIAFVITCASAPAFFAPGQLTAQDNSPLPQGMSIVQAVAALQANPGLQEVFRQRLQASGYTREQIHQRLRDAGYPEDILDPSPGPAASDSVPSPNPTQLAAVAKLGVDAFPPQLVQNADSVVAKMHADSAQMAVAREVTA